MLPNRAGRRRVPRRVAKMWQDDQPGPTGANDRQRGVAGQPHNADDIQQRPLSVPRFPWYY